jgi:hypothetical protein
MSDYAALIQPTKPTPYPRLVIAANCGKTFLPLWIAPVETRCKTELTGNDLRGIRALRAYLGADAPAVIVHAGQTCRKLDARTLAMPWNATPR